MNTDIPMPEDTANKLHLLKEEILQIIANPAYKKFLAELHVLREFIAGKASIKDAHKALKNLSPESTSP
jgi:hypothetical protein